MPLLEACNQVVGQELFVVPYYGHGWSRLDAGSPPETMLDSLGPEPFYIRVQECVYCENAIVGISGLVVCKQKQLSGYWCCCLLRSPEVHDFTAHYGDYLVYIAERKLAIFPEPYPKKPLGDWVAVDKTAFCLGGYGTVAESADWMKDVYDRTMKGREEVKKVMFSRNQLKGSGRV